MDEPLRYEKLDGGVAIVTNTDAPRNRMGLAYVERLSEVVDDIAADDEIRTFVITADGLENFSFGMNLKELPTGIQAAGSVDAFFDRRLDLIQRIENMGKPSVATLFGHCLGAGLELPLGCTFRLAAEEGASIGLPELHLGSTPAWGGSARLAKTVGRQHALGMVLRAKTVTGPQAHAIGLVDEVWPLDELKDRATQLALELAGQPALAVRAMLGAFHDCEHRTLDDLLAAERRAIHATLSSDDAREGMIAFLEKRPPVFNRPKRPR
ncbi:2,3-dehydroadipyl-CoA hydratase [Mycobacterium shottsii]|uniref:Enoyl-CoA hydratase n=1 Tax=Mycobacterium shottsii TaxID=133549 RepID=A0A7I7L821_9MYCO|nr:enoyl-CoA hydratase/isomerase family protein [Mycobacterium shottsii]QYL26447.1 2,3-dehydroadipyl-CoA hydratase [Mycobacterium shottsii]BBX55944.1 enoyl-CoA hydratase [Mycobacterium shottsii]